MKTSYLLIILLVSSCSAKKKILTPVNIKLVSRIKNKKINLTYLKPAHKPLNKAVLFIHGSSFPSEMASGFRMNGLSWMDNLAMAGYEVFALDFLGYGKSDRYDYMSMKKNKKKAQLKNYGSGKDVVKDIDIAVNYISQKLNISKVNLIGHSWGATVSGHYATLFPKKIDKLVLFAPIIQRNGHTNWKKTDDLYEDLTPAKRIKQFISKIPKGESITLEQDVLDYWKYKWLKSDSTSKLRVPISVRFPSAWETDLYNCWNGNCIFVPSKIKNSTLLIRGEWDTVFSFNDAKNLFTQLKNAPSKRLVIIDKSTHVLHLEKNRFDLYDEVKLFLRDKKL